MDPNQTDVFPREDKNKSVKCSNQRIYIYNANLELFFHGVKLRGVFSLNDLSADICVNIAKFVIKLCVSFLLLPL